VLFRTLANGAAACAVGLCVLGAPSPGGHGGPSPVAAGSHKPPTPSHQPPRVDIELSIPYVALGPVDGLPTALVRGRTYTVNIPVWVASNATTGVASVQIGDSSCRHNVRPGTTVRLTCAFTVRKAGPITLSAVVHLVNGAAAPQTYYHTA
jgi:hypothetical protein